MFSLYFLHCNHVYHMYICVMGNQLRYALCFSGIPPFSERWNKEFISMWLIHEVWYQSPEWFDWKRTGFVWVYRNMLEIGYSWCVQDLACWIVSFAYLGWVGCYVSCLWGFLSSPPAGYTLAWPRKTPAICALMEFKPHNQAILWKEVVFVTQ